MEIEYEVLPMVIDAEKGAAADAPLLHPDMNTYPVLNFIFPEPGTNVANHFRIRKGDPDSAFAKCAAVVEREYRVPHIQHVPIEPHIIVAKADEGCARVHRPASATAHT